MGGKLGDNAPGDRMKADQRELVVQNCTSERAVGIGAHHPEGHGEIHDRSPEHAPFLSLVRGKYRICVIGEPLDIIRQCLIRQWRKPLLEGGWDGGAFLRSSGAHPGSPPERQKKSMADTANTTRLDSIFIISS